MMARHLRYLLIIAGVTGVLYLAGCNNPRTSDAHLLVTEADMQQAETEGYLMPDAGEADYVEAMSAARQAYRDSLTALADYYSSVGNATKLQWANTELKTFDQMVHYRYLQPAEWVPENRTAMNSIEDADVLYDEAMSLFRQSGGMVVVLNKAKLRQALTLFNELIQKYPSSDKIDDAAYHAAQIYEHLHNYELAAVYYQRAFQWNEVTPYPARFRAAKIMDQKLKMRKEALALYKLAVEKESRYQENTEYAQMRINALSQPDTDMDMDTDMNTVPDEEAAPMDEQP